MSYNISKELFKEITGNDKTINEHNRECIINGNTEEYISFNDFHFMCKEWALKQGYILHSSIDEIGKGYLKVDKFNEELYGESIKTFTGDSEQQTVFDACQWILEKDKK